MENDLINIKLSLKHIASIINKRHLLNKREQDIPSLADFRKAAQNLKLAIYINKQDNLKTDNGNVTFHEKVSAQFGRSNNKFKNVLVLKLIKFLNLPPSPLVSSRSTKKELT